MAFSRFIMKLKQPLILASASPRRRELLATLAIPFDIVKPNVNEAQLKDETPKHFVERLAKAKADAVSSLDAIVIAADTVVVLDDCILGKPTDLEDAKRMLRALSGKVHQVITGVCVQNASRSIVFSLSTMVTFRALAEEEILMYVESGEPLDKAGAYAIQGNAASMVATIEGSYTNVIGLPLCEIYKILISFD